MNIHHIARMLYEIAHNEKYDKAERIEQIEEVLERNSSQNDTIIFEEMAHK